MPYASVSGLSPGSAAHSKLGTVILNVAVLASVALVTAAFVALTVTV